MKFSALAKDGFIASGRELVGITLDLKEKLEAPTPKQKRIFQKSYIKSMKGRLLFATGVQR
jgi:hypothetical protein